MLKESRFVSRYCYILMACSVLFVGFLYIPWTPGFPVTAKLIAVPGLYVAKAPKDSVVEEILVNKKEGLLPKQPVIQLRYLQALSQNTNQDADLRRLEHRLSRLNSVISRQDYYYKKYQLLADKKLLSMVELLQKKDELRRLRDEKEEFDAQIANLKLKMRIRLQIPFAGVMAQQLVQVGQMVHAKQALMVFRPLAQAYILKVKIPLIYQKYVKMKQELKLNFIQDQRIKTYPISARVSALYPHITSKDELGREHYFLMFSASVRKLPQLNGLAGINNLPLEGYLMGPRRPIYQWILDVI
ncbi:MAG: efflux RND transporter periplasmic adaptor subunit [Gammaproteobacteria bacterium]|nr:efflux RND transporter periplasmic adaptor subunit [Gammaproteobacteria bacterium]